VAPAPQCFPAAGCCSCRSERACFTVPPTARFSSLAPICASGLVPCFHLKLLPGIFCISPASICVLVLKQTAAASLVLCAQKLLRPKASWFCRPDPLAERADSGPRCPARAVLVAACLCLISSLIGLVFGFGAPALVQSAQRERRSRFTTAGVEGLARFCSLCA
jgi:hypothetical protein